MGGPKCNHMCAYKRKATRDLTCTEKVANGRRNKKRFGVAGLENCNDVAENQGMLAAIRS